MAQRMRHDMGAEDFNPPNAPCPNTNLYIGILAGISSSSSFPISNAYLHPLTQCQKCNKYILKIPRRKYKQTFELYVEGVNPLFDRLPTSICTETLAWDKSTPEHCSACVRVSNILSNTMNPVNNSMNDIHCNILEVSWTKELVSQ